MSKILKDLSELTRAGLITEETARSIEAFYIERARRSPNPVILVFGIFGALLAGLGIILIIAHNWDDLSKSAKLFFALLPLLLGQILCAYSLFKIRESRAWREATSVFLFFAIAASISIVSQVYNIPGDFSGFLFIWMILSIPVVYVMRSGMTSLLVILGITTYACSLSYFDYPRQVAWYYWPMLASMIPFFVKLIKTNSKNFVYFHRWFFAISFLITLNMFPDNGDGTYIFIGYMSLFSLYILLGEIEILSRGRIISNAFLVVGNLGSTCLLLGLSFYSTWTWIAEPNTVMNEVFFVSALLSILATGLLIYSIRRKGVREVHPLAFLFVIFILLFQLGKAQPFLAPWLVNILVLGIAVMTTWRGAEKDSMLILNYGLLIMVVLIFCRFFDTDMSFVVRGILFLITGLGFFAANYWVLRRRKLQDI